MKQYFFAFLILLLSISVQAQDGFFNGFTLRKSFQSQSTSSDPAIITFLNPEGKSSSWLLNAAVGYNLLQNNSVVLELSPYIEYNRNTLIEKEQNNWQMGLSSEWQPLSLIDKGWTPVLIGVVKYYDDQIKKNSSIQGNYYFTPIFEGKKLEWKYFWIPNNVSNLGKILQFSYAPYIGFEHENRLRTMDAESLGSIYRLMFRVTTKVTLFPKNENLRDKFEMNTDYQYRTDISESIENMSAGNYSYFAAGVNYLLFSFEDGKRVAKIGLDYTNGENPLTNFEKQAFYAVTLKLKL